MEKYKEIERSIIVRFRKEIWRRFTKAVRDYELIKEGDKVAVCISGGKDSFLLAKCIEELKKHGRVKFDVKYLVMNPGYNELNKKKIEENAKILNIDINYFESNIFDAVKDVKENPCYLCARMRRGNLYSFAKSLGCNKIALGHHFDDVIETTLLSIIYGGEIKGMMPKLHSDNFDGMELIRPLYLVREKDIKSWAKYNDLTFINCACKLTEKACHDENASKRLKIKNLIKKLEDENSFVPNNIFKSTENVNLDMMREYKSQGKRYNFLNEYDEKRNK
ncbi:MAG: tRNA 2-thiocytidine biosynthesis protein TtcA [Bacilli bacterium]|nr:tRNA 2-thiocytidine biosynthesis protein TtcA [Bacilli bacterium]